LVCGRLPLLAPENRLRKEKTGIVAALRAMEQREAVKWARYYKSQADNHLAKVSNGDLARMLPILKGMEEKYPELAGTLHDDFVKILVARLSKEGRESARREK
jgi:hypothetical protein